MTKRSIAMIAAFLVSAVAGAACRTAAPTRRPVQPPWITNGPSARVAEISLTAEETRTVDGPESVARIIVGAGARLEARGIGEVTGPIVIHNGGTLVAPNLTTCFNMIRLGEGAEVSAPELRRVEQLIVGNGSRVNVPALELVTGLIVMGSESALIAPALRRHGGIQIGERLYSCSKLPEGVRIDAPCAEGSASRLKLMK